ncbi:FecR domain-containing protein [Magnetovibrio sp.]|uniref:FecR domain-containing protein n=1 Tax=Magnetovibrio sp. TaxID=2024836 RepID=UPI002F929FCA
MKQRPTLWVSLLSLSAVLLAVIAWSTMSAIAALPPAPIGAVDALKGKGWGKGAVGGRYDKLVGDLVVMDEVLGTGRNSNMKLTFIDGTTMSLGSDAEIMVDEMVYDPNDAQGNRVVLHLGVGAFYFVSGQVAKDKVTIITPTTTIGIRGTELVINVSQDGSTSVGVSKGHAFMDSRSAGGGRAEIEVGNTARSDANGRVGRSFPGIDLTGDDNVDRNIPGVSDWYDAQSEEDEDGKFGEFTETEDDEEDGRVGEDEHGKQNKDDEYEDGNFNGIEDEDGQEHTLDLAANDDDDEGRDDGKESDDGGEREGSSDSDDGGGESDGGSNADGGDGGDGGDGDDGDDGDTDTGDADGDGQDASDDDNDDKA